MYIIYNTMDFSILNKTISLVAKRNRFKSRNEFRDFKFIIDLERKLGIISEII